MALLVTQLTQQPLGIEHHSLADPLITNVFRFRFMGLQSYLRCWTYYHNSLGRLSFFGSSSWMRSQPAASCLTPLPYLVRK